MKNREIALVFEIMIGLVVVDFAPTVNNDLRIPVPMPKQNKVDINL